jgi:8-oxo-dGTP pyrophosphatase MutT (NUDIX family)/transcriptional regulator with XRE-family HTH domain
MLGVMSPDAYDAVLAANIRAARARAGLQQEPLAARMRALGFAAWQRQTVASIEKGRRRVTAEEVFGLALALETTMPALQSPSDPDSQVALPSSDVLPAVSVVRLAGHGGLARALNDRAVRWDGDKPVFQRVPASLGETWPGAPGAELPQRQPVVAAIVTSREGVLITRRKDGRPTWGFVSGEIEPGESPEDAAVREVKEETGLEVRAGGLLGQRLHPATGRTMIYLSAVPERGTDVFVGDTSELAEVRWASLAEADELLPGMFDPVHEYLEREIGGRK